MGDRSLSFVDFSPVSFGVLGFIDVFFETFEVLNFAKGFEVVFADRAGSKDGSVSGAHELAVEKAGGLFLDGFGVLGLLAVFHGDDVGGLVDYGE